MRISYWLLFWIWNFLIKNLVGSNLTEKGEVKELVGIKPKINIVEMLAELDSNKILLNVKFCII